MSDSPDSVTQRPLGIHRMSVSAESDIRGEAEHANFRNCPLVLSAVQSPAHIQQKLRLRFYASDHERQIAGAWPLQWLEDNAVIRVDVEVSEQEAPVLYKIVRELSAKAGKPMPRIYIAPTMSPNAFATGRNERHAAVCCTQGILQMLNEREIRGVLGHELMHVYNHDILTSAIASAMATVISYLGYSLMYFGGGNSRDDRNGSSSNGLGLLGVLLSTILAPIAASLIQMAISRTREYDADEDGSMLTEDPEALASALNKISNGAEAMPMQKTAGTQSVAAMMIANPFSAEGFSRLFSTHPATEDRIARLMQMSQEMKARGVQSGYLAGGYATSGYASADIRRQDGDVSGAGFGSGGYSGGGYSRDYSQNPVQGGYGR